MKNAGKKIANLTKMKFATWERRLAAGRGDKLDARYKRERKGKRKGRTWDAARVQASPG